MTVKCIKQSDKHGIAFFHRQKVSIKELAEMYKCSARTIRRVLKEHEMGLVKHNKPVVIPTKPSLVYLTLRFIKNLFSPSQPNV